MHPFARPTNLSHFEPLIILFENINLIVVNSVDDIVDHTYVLDSRKWSAICTA